MMVATVEEHIVFGDIQEQFLLGLKAEGVDFRDVNLISQELTYTTRFCELAPTRSPEGVLPDLLKLQRNLQRIAGLIVGNIPGPDDPIPSSPEGGWSSKFVVIGGAQQRILEQFSAQGIDVRTLNLVDPETLKKLKRETGQREIGLINLQQAMLRVAGMVLAKPDNEAEAVRTFEVEVPEVHRLIRNVLTKIAGEMVPGMELTLKVGVQGDMLRIVDPEGLEHVVKVAGDVLEVEGEGKGSKFQDRLRQLALSTNQQDKARRNRKPRGSSLSFGHPISSVIPKKLSVSDDEMETAVERVKQIQGRD